MYVVKENTANRLRNARGNSARRGSRTLRLRQEDRTAATRKRLLAAAGRIFARDGFEAARLEEIASEAGYTRGAFYANFDDKEELFFALLEQWVVERMAEVNALLQRARSVNAQFAALRKYYAHSAGDRRFVLLSLEFRLYAIRHPAAHARLRLRMRRLRSCGADLLHRIAKSKGYSLPVPAGAAAAALGAFSNALFLEHLVDAKTVSEQNVRTVLTIFFNALAAPQPPK